MKSELLFSAAGTIALMLSSCSADVPIANNTTDGAISYNVVTVNQTRALNSYDQNQKPMQFKVWASLYDGTQVTEPFYINGDDIISTDGDKYFAKGGAQYWPHGGELYFYAIADKDNSETNNTKSNPKFVITNDTVASVENYTINSQASQQLDLMYAVQKDAAHNHDVNLNFRHALSQICFKAKNENSESIITIKSITVKNVLSEGSYTLPTETTITGNSATADDGANPHGTWNYTENRTDYKISFEDDEINLSCNKDYVPDLTDLSVVTKDGNKDITKVLNLLPQTMAIDSENPISLELAIEVYKKNDDGTKDKLLFPPTSTNSDENQTIVIPLSTDWKEGTRYTYTLIFAKDWNTVNLKDIKYTVNVDGYNDYNKDLPVINNHKAVLMRSGDQPLYFATTNIDADKPTDTGLYFWWGDTKGYKYYNGNQEHSEFLFDEKNPEIKTWALDLTDPNSEDSKEWLNCDGNLNPNHDAAHIHWGGPWRMPTKEDLTWLANTNNCNWEPITNKDPAPNNIVGYKVTSRDTGNSIFLPAAGYIGKDNQDQTANTRYTFHKTCWIWSSTPYTHPQYEHRNAWRLTTKDSNISCGHEGKRLDGFPIRPVADTLTPTDTP